MIIINDEIQKPNEQMHNGFFGNSILDPHSAEYKFQLKVKPPHNFFPNKIVPKQQSHIKAGIDCLNGNLLYSANKGKHFVYDTKSQRGYCFLTSKPARDPKQIDNQIFYRSSDCIYSATESNLQSLDIKSIDMDTCELTNELFVLQDDRIKIINSTDYLLSCANPRRIVVLDHPREVLLATDYSIFHLDLRQDKVINQVYQTSDKIVNIKKSNSKIIVKNHNSISVLKNLSYTKFDTLATKQLYQFACNDNEIILHKRNNFEFYDIDNLCCKEVVKYDICNYLGFAAEKKSFYFLTTRKTYGFNCRNEKFKYGPVYSAPKWRHFFYVSFFEPGFSHFEHDHECVYQLQDVQSELYDEVMKDIKAEGDEKIKSTLGTQNIKLKMIKRDSGF